MNYWLQPGRWRVAPWNYRPEARGCLALPGEASIFVVDSTSRSAVTTEPGTTITPDGLLEIASALADIGATETVYNVTTLGEPVEIAIAGARKVRAAKVPIATASEMGVVPEQWKELLRFTMGVGLDTVQVCYGLQGEIPGYTGKERAMDTLQEAIEYSISQGQATAFGYNLQHTDDPDFVCEFFRRGSRLGVNSLRLYDPTTSTSPHGMYWLVTAIKNAIGPNAPPLVVHTHNYWGLASSCAISAVLAGADGIDLVVNALGTHPAHTPFAETVVALEALYGVRTGIKMEKLTTLSRLVEKLTGVPLSPRTPAVGSDFSLVEAKGGRMMGIYEELDGGPEYDVPYAPSLVGQKHRLLWGRNSVQSPLLAYMLRKIGLEPTADRIERARATLNEALARKKSYPVLLEEAEVKEILGRL